MERYNVRNFKKERRPLRSRKSSETKASAIKIPSNRRLAALSRTFPIGVTPQTPREHFDTRRITAGIISTPLVREPIIPPHNTSKGTIYGGTSDEAIYRGKRKF